MALIFVSLHAFVRIYSKACKLIDKTDNNTQLSIFRMPLVNVIIIKNHELVEQAQRMDLILPEKEFAPYLSWTLEENSIVFVRKMVGACF
ncbi:MAG: hypothetical protein GX660_02465 [Clostridiaceae bacterium]|nr:hypothetical protein [Clostridiaceae bacterium]